MKLLGFQTLLLEAIILDKIYNLLGIAFFTNCIVTATYSSRNGLYDICARTVIGETRLILLDNEQQCQRDEVNKSMTGILYVQMVKKSNS